MKRVLTFLAALLLPLSVMAMAPVSDSALSDVTGQAGVNINADITMNIDIDTLAWGDEDGVGGDSTGGYIGVEQLDINNLRIRARATDSYNGYDITQLHPITIDVATDAGLYGGKTFVRLGLGSLQISMDALTVGIRLGATSDNLDQLLGTVNLGAMNLFINPESFVDIYAHDGCGVNMTMDVELDHISLPYVSWGDTDGLAAGSPVDGVAGYYWIEPYATGADGGFVGIHDLAIGATTATGTVAIDVATSAAGVYSHGGLDPVAVVHMSFSNSLTVKVDSVTGNINLASDAALTDNAKTLGNFVINDMNLQVVDGSWVDIWAH